MGFIEKRVIKSRQDNKNNKFVLIREHIMEMDSVDVPAKINEVKNYIVQMERQAQWLETELEHSRRELDLLQNVARE